MTNPTVNFLRTFNRWRRGDEALSQPCPRVIGQMLDDACDQIERLERERDEARIQYRTTLTLAEVLANKQVEFKRERDADRRTIELLREARDGYKRMAGVSPDWQTAESVRDKFSPGECVDE